MRFGPPSKPTSSSKLPSSPLSSSSPVLQTSNNSSHAFPQTQTADNTSNSNNINTSQPSQSVVKPQAATMKPPSPKPTPLYTKASSVVDGFRKSKKRPLSSSSKQKRRKLVLQPVHGDGNCLFRSVSFQIYGDENWHDRVREECCDFMSQDEVYYREFVEGDFKDYIRQKRRNGTFGDNPEIQAIAELYNRPVIVYTTDFEEDDSFAGEEDDEELEYVHIESVARKVKRMNIFHNKYAQEECLLPPIRLCYRGKSHYDAVIDPYAATVGVGLGFPGLEPGKADRDLLTSAAWATDVEATERELERVALAASIEDLLSVKRSNSTKTSSSSSTKKRRKYSSSSRSSQFQSANSSASAAMTTEVDFKTAATTTSSSSSASTCDLSSSSALAFATTYQDGLSQPVRELLLNGFSLEQVMAAQAIAGDSFDDMLAILISST